MDASQQRAESRIRELGRPTVLRGSQLGELVSDRVMTRLFYKRLPARFPVPEAWYLDMLVPRYERQLALDRLKQERQANR